MALPFFYLSAYDPGATEIALDEDNSRHIAQVLRMQPGEDLQLTDGKGALLTASILDNHKKKCVVGVRNVHHVPPREERVFIAISPLKNASRFEWFLEKATEIGVAGIIPLLCDHTERQHTRTDRLQHILVSALLQSRQAWLPILHPPAPFVQWTAAAPFDRRLIAHCLQVPRPTESLARLLRQYPATPAPSVAPLLSVPAPSAAVLPPAPTTLILIGPEGDFSPKEVETALKEGFIPVTLGNNRLRTETAGVVAATLLCIG